MAKCFRKALIEKETYLSKNIKKHKHNYSIRYLLTVTNINEHASDRCYLQKEYYNVLKCDQCDSFIPFSEPGNWSGLVLDNEKPDFTLPVITANSDKKSPHYSFSELIDVEVKRDMKDSINEIKKEIGDATLVAVSKTKSNEDIMAAYELGIKDFGENYVQELITKMDSLPTDINWHMIGHLQTNKVKDLIKRNIYLIESVDSIKLAKEINKEAIKNNKTINILVEVNISKDINKTGCSIEELDQLIKEIKELPNINLKGLMAIAPNTDNASLIKKSFKHMKELKDKYNLELLSMGMSNDYLLAIEEGSNIVRIGTKIFGARIYK